MATTFITIFISGQRFAAQLDASQLDNFWPASKSEAEKQKNENLKCTRPCKTGTLKQRQREGERGKDRENKRKIRTLFGRVNFSVNFHVPLCTICK